MNRGLAKKAVLCWLSIAMGCVFILLTVYGDDLLVSGESCNTGLNVVVYAPGGFTDRVELYACSNLVAGDWRIATQNLQPLDGSPAQWHAGSSGTGFFIAGNMDVDSDGDGLPDARELFVHKTNSQLADTDSDGLRDGWEVQNGYNPLFTNGLDLDGDGLSNADEFLHGTKPDVSDSDADGMPDGWEVSRGLNPLVNDAGVDPDDDGLTNFGEFMAGAHPFTRDTDEDGIPDGWEVGHGSSPLNKSDGLSDPDGDGLNNLETYQTHPGPSAADTDGDGFVNAYDVRVNEFDYPVVGTTPCNLVASWWYLSPIRGGAGFGANREQLLTLSWSANFYYPPHPPSSSGGYLEDGLCVRPGYSQLRWQGIPIPGNNGLELYGRDEYFEDYWFILGGFLRSFWQPQLPDGLPYNIDSDSRLCHPSDLENEISTYAYSQPSLCCPTNGNGFLYSRSWEEYTYGEDCGVIATQTYYYCIQFSREASEAQPPLTFLEHTDTMGATGGGLQPYGQSVFKLVFNQPVTNKVVKWLTYSEDYSEWVYENYAVHQCEVTGRESGLFSSADQHMIVPAVDLNGDFDSDGDVDNDDTILRAPASASLPIVPTGQTNEMPGSGVVPVTVNANVFAPGMPASVLKLKFSGVDSGEHFRLWRTTDIVPQEPASRMAGMTMVGGGGELRSTRNIVPEESAKRAVMAVGLGSSREELIEDPPLLINTQEGLEHEWPVKNISPYMQGVDYVYMYRYAPDFPKTLYLECVSCDAASDGRAKIELSYEYNGEEICATALPITVIRSKLVSDWNHDRSIDMADQNQDTNNAPFRFWINDDNDSGDISEGDSDVPGQGGWFSSANYEDDLVNGHSDLSDFFSVRLDIGAALSNYSPGNGNEYRLKQADGALKFVYTDLTNTNAGDYLIASNRTCGVAMNQNSYEADTLQITSSGVLLDTNFLNRIAANTNKGVLMMEAVAESTAPLVLEIWQNDSKVWETRLALSLSGVEDMYRKVNLRNMQNPGALPEPPNNPDASSNGKNLIFLHGYQPDVGDSGDMSAWLSEMFKRFYQSGSKAKFHGVFWYSNQGDPVDYQKNVTNAFCTAPVLRDYVAGLDGDVVVAAHSLGNMVVSSAIVDQNMSVSKYMMCDAAVASEAYDATMPQDNNLVNEWWTGYSNRTWAANWYQLFADTGDSRTNLTWRNKFKRIVSRTEVFSFYSDGDEVFDLTPNQGLFTGTIGVDANWWFVVPVEVDVNINFGRYSWQKQELFKGCRYSDGWASFGGTSWAGWGVESELQLITWHGLPAIAMVQAYTNAAGANMATDEQLRGNPVFEHTPSWLVGTGVLSQTQIDEMLGMGIPALTPSTGRSSVDNFTQNSAPQFNLNNTDPNATNFKPNGWPMRGDPDYQNWLHNDMITVAYFFNYKLFEEMVESGVLK